MIFLGAIVVLVLAVAVSDGAFRTHERSSGEAKAHEAIPADVLEEMRLIDEAFPDSPPCEPERYKKERIEKRNQEVLRRLVEESQRRREAAVLAGMEAKPPGSGGRSDIAAWNDDTFECVMKDGTRVAYRAVNLYGWTEALRRARSG